MNSYFCATLFYDNDTLLYTHTHTRIYMSHIWKSHHVKIYNVLIIIYTILSSFQFISYINIFLNQEGLPGDSNGKESAYNAGDSGSIPGSGRSPGERNGNPLQFSCLENSMDREAQWATVHEVTKSQTRLSN